MSEQLALKRNASKKTHRSTSTRVAAAECSADDVSRKPLVRRLGSRTLPSTETTGGKRVIIGSWANSLLRSFISFFHLSPACRWLALPADRTGRLGRRVTGTLFGHKKGHVSFAVQEQPGAEPVLLLELATPTSLLVKEMASGLVRIALECEKARGGVAGSGRLLSEPVWTMHCNGRKSGYAVARACEESDWKVLRTVQTVSIGAGVIPAEGGEVLYMRAKFERVVGSRDSEAFYMLNPDGNGGPELSIFLLRL